MNFFVTLPSNSKGIYKENTTSDFTTILARPIKFDYPTKVGLSEIIFTTKWSVFLGNLVLENEAEKTVKTLPMYALDGSSFTELIEALNHNLERHYFTDEYRRRLVDKTHPNYKLLHDLPYVRYFEKELEASGSPFKLLPPKDMEKISISIFEDIKKVHPAPQFKFQNGSLSFEDFKGLQISFTDRLELIFGEEKYNSKSTDVHVMKQSVESVRAFFVYSDIIEYQFVGDALAPLLRNVAIPRLNIGTVSAIFENPDYLRVNKTEINKININICDDRGRKIQFHDGKVIVKLNFKSLDLEI